MSLQREQPLAPWGALTQGLWLPTTSLPIVSTWATLGAGWGEGEQSDLFKVTQGF